MSHLCSLVQLHAIAQTPSAVSVVQSTAVPVARGPDSALPATPYSHLLPLTLSRASDVHVDRLPHHSHSVLAAPPAPLALLWRIPRRRSFMRPMVCHPAAISSDYLSSSPRLIHGRARLPSLHTTAHVHASHPLSSGRLNAIKGSSEDAPSPIKGSSSGPPSPIKGALERSSMGHHQILNGPSSDPQWAIIRSSWGHHQVLMGPSSGPRGPSGGPKGI